MPPAFVGFANFSGNLLVSKSKQSLQSKSFLGVSVSSEHPISRGQFTPAGGKSRIVCLSWGVKGGVEKFADSLVETARSIASPGKGILAVDESTKTIGKRLASIGVENTEENRQAYRELLFTCEGLGQYISGAILFEETLYQNARNGKSFVDCLRGVGVIPGIKVDKGLSPLPGGEAIETWCTGLDGLSERAAAYYKQGARFAKWRAVLQISPETPTELCVQENARGLARYAKTVQEQGLVPIIEPEILMDGDHDIERTAQVQEHVLATVYKECDSNGVLLEGSLLKPNMTVPGADCKRQFLLQYLELCSFPVIQRRGPWSLSFSYGRALQQSCLKSWKGKQENVKAAQEALLARARANSKANLGKYVPGSEPTLDKTGTFEKAYVY
ncbi:Probable fructose-bisphosphate aldolase 3, chloroplastic [Galdieria sulphuraria]|nr:Probable fructose-bisphosphate aldolase 3, chloroplastic [Galdieria sulphuraria]